MSPFKGFAIQVALRVAFLALMLAGGLLFLIESSYKLTAAFLLVVSVLMVFDLIRFVLRQQRQLNRFLEAVEYEDINLRLPSWTEGKPFEDFRQMGNLILRKMAGLREQREQSHLFLQALVAHVPTGIICAEDNGRVRFMNDAASRMLPMAYLNQLERLDKLEAGMSRKLKDLKHGERLVLKLVREDRVVQIGVHAVWFRLGQDHLSLYLLSPLSREMEGKEMEAWQKLTRVLSHEIMNSITPIVSLAATAVELCDEIQAEQGEEALEDVQAALMTIEKRGRHLLGFTEAYRQLNRLPPPYKQQTELYPMLRDVVALLQPAFEAEAVLVHVEKPSFDTCILGDETQLEQVFINILKNALDALSGEKKPLIEVQFRRHENEIEVRILDNGPGLHPDVADKVFIPFFSTKKAGSGIGLSLSRQIIWAHGGSLQIGNRTGTGVEVRILLPKD